MSKRKPGILQESETIPECSLAQVRSSICIIKLDQKLDPIYRNPAQRLNNSALEDSGLR